MKKKQVVKAASKTKKTVQPTGLRKVHHHAKRILGITPKFVHGAILGAIVGVVIVSGLRGEQAAALSITAPRDCDTNAVINCGALNTAELKQRYNNQGVSAIYNYFGIAAQDISSIDTTAAAGLVYKDGGVTVGGKTVATNAVTAGRENISGSTKVTSGGVTFYKRPPKVSFRPDSIAAYVVMKDGQFKFAILAPCGNPVTATAVPKPTPTPKPTPQPETTPVAPVVSVASTQTPPSTPVAQVAAASTIAELPNTGPGAVLIVALAAVVGGYIFHAGHRHIKRRRAARAGLHHARPHHAR
jgi:hypothetical protein